MTQYVFEPNDLQRIVRMHLDAPLDERFDRIAETLNAVYGDHIHTGEEWIWSNAGGIMCSMRVLHTSLKEYLLFCGTAVGSEGHSGRLARFGPDVTANEATGAVAQIQTIFRAEAADDDEVPF